MIKNCIIITLLLISLSTLQAYKQDCSHYSEEECCKDEDCWWDDTKECHNRIDCDKLSLELCSSTKDCKFTPGTPGHCDPIDLKCETKDKKHCLDNKLCLWKPNQICKPNEPQPCPPDCCTFNDKECKKNSEYCDSHFTCTDQPDYCDNLNEKQCGEVKGCSFKYDYDCVENKKTCESLTNDQCKKNSDYCELEQVQNASCVNKYDCSELSCEYCKKYEGACESYIVTPFQCLNKKDICAKETCEDDCEHVKGCNWNPKTQTCSSCTNCALFDKEACQANCEICDYIPEETGCRNAINCCVYNKKECKESQWCTITPPVFKCKSKECGCDNLTPAQCRENRFCQLVKGKGKCVKDGPFGCVGLTASQCIANKKCNYQTSCTDKVLRPCDQLNVKECQNSSYCHLEDCGQCIDGVSIKCPKDEDTCNKTKYCNWIEGTDGCCENQVDCSTANIKECERNPFCCLGDGNCRNN